MIGTGAPHPHSVKKQIVINASKDRSRIAIVEDGELVELYVETPDNVRSIGNVYLAEVQKVMPALRAAFVDVGQKQDCFLHFSDLTDNLPQLLALAGEDVPGLDEPVLSLAPPKRVADDEDEPDVEESLEIEPAPEESRSRRTSRRRSRGRGRGRGRGRSGGGREEEEEQEERGRRALPSVIDLTAPSKPRRPAPKPEEPKAEEPEPTEPESDASSPDASAPVEQAAPKKKRTRSRKADPQPDAETQDSEGEAPDASATETEQAEVVQEEAAHDDSEDKPEKKRRRRGKRGGKKSDGSSSDEASDEDDAPDEPEAGDEVKDEPAKPKRSRSRKKTEKEDEPTSDDSGTEQQNEPEPESKPKTSTRKLPATLDLTSSAKPRRSRPTGDAGRQQDEERSDEATADEPSKDDKPSGRSRRRSRSDDSSGGDESSPRGFKKPEADGDADDSESTSANGDRQSRRGRGRKSSEASDTTGSDEASDASESEDPSSEPRSRRGGRSGRGRGRSSDSSDSKEQSDDGKEAASEKDSDKESNGRSGRGRSGSRSRSSDSDSSDRSSGSRSSDSRSGGRSAGGRGGRDNGRSNGRSSAGRSGSIPPNEQLLKRGGRIIVKITKEAISNKGPRVSTDLSLAGRFLVLVPAADYVAVSKKIESAKERRRLRTLATSLKPDGFGVIVRTVAEGRDAKSLDTDLRLLADKWRKIQNKLDEGPNPPVLLYQDVNMVSSVIRDLFSEDYDRILVDDEKTFRNVQAYVKAVAPQMADKVEFHKGRGQVYRSLGIEKQVEEAFSKRVNMKSGGYLFIETTEAMHVVDVNSGRAGRGKSQKQNLIDVNVEAAREVAKQLRLRDLGGIIVVDFIDLKYDRDRRKVTDALKKAFEKDRAVTKLLPMSDFGLVQITRQRLRPSITAGAVDDDGEPLHGQDAMEAAGAAEIVQPGKSMDVGIEPESQLRDDRPERPAPRERAAVAPEDATPQALAGRLRDWLETYRQSVEETYRTRPIVVKVHPLFGAYLKRGFPSVITRWRLSIRGINFSIDDDASVDPLAFDVSDQKSGRSLLKKYSDG